MGVKGFVEGGIASIVAGCSTHPLDLIKVRMQLQGEEGGRGDQIVALPQDVPVAPLRKSGPLAGDSGPPRGPRPWSRVAAWAGAPLPRGQVSLVGVCASARACGCSAGKQASCLSES